jgi:hypothetical protein
VQQILDEAVAREVASRFLAAASRPRDPLVERAYAALEVETDRAFVALTTGWAGSPIRVVFTGCREPYASDREMIEAVRSTRLLEVVANAADRERLHPVLGNEQGGAYDRFRAVHDVIGHVQNRFGFDRHGEFAAWLAQEAMHSPMARLALATELHAEHSVRWTSGVVAEHKATLLGSEVLARARRGASGSHERPQSVPSST